MLRISLLLPLGLVASTCFAQPAISPPHQQSIQEWLTAHPGYRLATAADCHCDEDIEFLRKGDGAAWEPQPDFDPYLGRGDFDGDGSQDIAVVVISPDARSTIFVLVSFDSRQGRSGDLISVAREGTSVAGRGLSVRRPDAASKDQRSLLLWGALASEAEEIEINR